MQGRQLRVATTTHPQINLEEETTFVALADFPGFFFHAPFSVGRAVSCLDCCRAESGSYVARSGSREGSAGSASSTLPIATGLRRRAPRGAQKGGPGALLRAVKNSSSGALAGRQRITGISNRKRTRRCGSHLRARATRASLLCLAWWRHEIERRRSSAGFQPAVYINHCWGHNAALAPTAWRATCTHARSRIGASPGENP